MTVGTDGSTKEFLIAGMQHTQRPSEAVIGEIVNIPDTEGVIGVDEVLEVLEQYYTIGGEAEALDVLEKLGTIGSMMGSGGIAPPRGLVEGTITAFDTVFVAKPTVQPARDRGPAVMAVLTAVGIFGGMMWWMRRG